MYPSFFDSPIGILIFAIIAAFLLANLPFILIFLISLPFMIARVIFGTNTDQNIPDYSNSYSSSQPSGQNDGVPDYGLDDRVPDYRQDDRVPDYDIDEIPDSGPTTWDIFKGYFD